MLGAITLRSKEGTKTKRNKETVRSYIVPVEDYKEYASYLFITL
ncbi:hypothetical protein Vi05172_g10089 [Venturia inaequalis]|nr:hypothetical protein Vi05172_g10089 [Venturia inaequalis]